VDLRVLGRDEHVQQGGPKRRNRYRCLHEELRESPGFPALAFGRRPEAPVRYICWTRGFVGAVWTSDTDQTSGAVICKPFDQVADVGRVTVAVLRAWRVLRDLPLP